MKCCVLFCFLSSAFVFSSSSIIEEDDILPDAHLPLPEHHLPLPPDVVLPHEHEEHEDHDDDELETTDEPPSKPHDSEDPSSLLQMENSLPAFLIEPKDTYVMKNKPAVLYCKAAHALKLYFRCNGAKNVPVSRMDHVDPHSGVRVSEAEANITRNMVEEYFGKDKFRCECYAWSGRGESKSMPAFVEVAYLKKNFVSNPYSVNVELGGQTQLRCIPPQGVPSPRVYWLRNGAPLEATSDPANMGTSGGVNTGTNSGLLVSTDGHLLINEARLQHTGNYTCVAENMAAKRHSETVTITVFVNGGWSAWSLWIDCKCPGLTLSVGKKRTRTCTNPAPLNGGRTCQGPNVQRDQDCAPCQVDDLETMMNTFNMAVDGGWSTWSHWSECGPDCRQWRKRSCTQPPASGGGLPCPGRSRQTQYCCDSNSDQHGEAAPIAETQTDMALYIGITVALLVFSVVAGFLIRVFRRKGRDHSLYNMATNEFQPSEFYPDHDKKSLQPDLTIQTSASGGGVGHATNGGTALMPPCYEYPFSNGSLQSHQSMSEHHYDVPHLAGAPGGTSSPSASSSSCCSRGANDSAHGNQGKHPTASGKNDLESVSSGFTSSDSTYDVATETVTLPLPVLPTAYAITPTRQPSVVEQSIYSTTSVVTHTGGYLHLTNHGVALSIPENSVPKGKKYELQLGVLVDDRYRPKLPENYTQLSPVVQCSPELSFNKPIVLKFPHCAYLEHNFWEICIFVSTNGNPEWRKMVVLGQETINTPIYTQMDTDSCYIMSESISRLVLAGKSNSDGKALKNLKLAVFAPLLGGIQTAVDFNIRVYVLEDTPSSLQTVIIQEKKVGGYLLDKPKNLTFRDTGSNLCLSLTEISDGWNVKPCSNYQEIPFKHVWQSNSNILHCSFALEQNEPFKNLKFKILCAQNGSNQQQSFEICVPIHCQTNQGFESPLRSRDTPNSSIRELPFDSPLRTANNASFDSPLKSVNTVCFESPAKVMYDNTTPLIARSSNNISDMSNCSPKNVLVTDRGVSTCEDLPFKLNKQVRKQLCQCLDPPNNRMNDWRMLAKALSVDRYINYFATKASPTEHILDLWECRNRQGSALTELMSILRAMGRSDAVGIIEHSLGPSWL